MYSARCSVLSIVCAVLGELTCNSGEVYVAVTKQCGAAATEESYQILSGSTVLKTSAAFADSEKRTDEFCLSATTNSQYTFKLLDTGGNSWSAGSWVSAAGIYGNTVLKTFMTDNGEENYALSLYYPVMKTTEWKMTSASSTIAWIGRASPSPKRIGIR